MCAGQTRSDRVDFRRMTASEADPKLASKVHRRWRGFGALLFVVFYSFFFSGHRKLMNSTVYMKDGVVMGAAAAAVHADLTLPDADAGSKGTGEASSFLLVHRAPVALLESCWQPFSQNAGEAKKLAVGTLQSIAGALAAVFLYHLLLWSGLGIWNSVMLAAVLGFSTTATVFTAVPQVQVFSMLGLTGMLAAMASGEQARWWEFSASALYSVLCSHWNLVPVAILALSRAVWRWRTSDSFKPVPAVVGSMSLLILVASGAMMLQSAWYPKSSQMDVVAVTKSSMATLQQARERAAVTPWTSRLQDVFFTSILAPTPTMLDQSHAQERSTRRVVSLVDQPWFALDFRHAVWAGWLLLLVVALAGLPAAAGHTGVATGALALLGWQVLFHGSLEQPGERLLDSAAWTPLVVALTGIGMARALARFKGLGVPLAVLLPVFVMVEAMRNQRFIQEIAEQLRLSAAM